MAESNLFSKQNKAYLDDPTVSELVPPLLDF